MDCSDYGGPSRYPTAKYTEVNWTEEENLLSKYWLSDVEVV